MAIQRHRIPDSLTEGGGTITATFGDNSYSVLPNYGSLLPSTRYQIYMAPGGTLEVLNLEPSQTSNKILIGSFYTSVTTTFLQFANINLPEYYNITEIIDASGSGGVASGNILVSRQGNVATVSNDGNVLNHANNGSVVTAAGFLPHWATPDKGIGNVAQTSASQIFRTSVTSSGEVVQEYRDYTGAASSRTNSSSFSLNYLLSNLSNPVTPIKDL